VSAASRRKGLTGEREVARLCEAAGFTARGLESHGDWLMVGRPRRPGEVMPRILHVEVKRQERLRLPEWLEQARNEAPEGVPPVVCFRQSRGVWYAVLTLDDLLGLVG
jgi:hypothetical protein